jgi:hypothetical protein
VKAVAKQMTLGDLQTDAEEQAEIEAGYVWRAQLWSAMRSFASAYIGPNGLKGYAAVAAALDRRWGGDAFGRPVSESTLGAALRDSERNYFRLEWVDWFAARSPEIADLLARRVKPVKTPEQELEDLKAEVRSEMPKRAEAIFRNARGR